MKAIILAAGRGSRLKNLTNACPKCLLELHGKSLLEIQLSSIRQAGITQIAIVTGYKRELLANRTPVEFYNPFWAVTNMVSSLTYAHEWLQTEPCVVSYSDIFYNTSAVQSLIQCPAVLAITYDPNWLELWTRRFGNPLLDAETFRITPESTLAEIGNKPESINEIQGQYMGLLRFTPEGWHEMLRIRADLTQDEYDKMHITSALQKIIEAGRIPISALPYTDKWGEVDTQTDLEYYAAL